MPTVCRHRQALADRGTLRLLRAPSPDEWGFLPGNPRLDYLGSLL